MYDYAIIGSGVSGGRIAYELSKSGANCVLIEAGKRFLKTDFPKPEIDYSSQLFWNGGLEIGVSGKLGFLRAKVLGGTSIVNQALLDEFDDLAFDDWKSRSGINYFSHSTFKPYYDRITGEVPISEVDPKFYNRNTKLFIEGFNKCNFQWSPLHRAQGDCKLDQGTDCISCLGGCPRESKQSSLVTVIRKAEQKGLKVETDFEVMGINPSPNGSDIFGIQRGQKTSLRAKFIVLASGAFGNSAILMRSGMNRNLPAVGTSFSCHPQFMTYALYNEPVDSHKGAFQAVKSYDPKLRKLGVKFENVFAPPISTAMLFSGNGKKHYEKMRKIRYLASMEVAVRDEPIGKIKMDKTGKILIEKDMTSNDWNKAREGLSIIKQMFASTGAVSIEQCMQGFGLHLMGGCPMGVDAKNSVVDPEFRIHGYNNIFAADSSVFPSAPGINPSFTIMAMSLLASEKILKAAKI